MPLYDTRCLVCGAEQVDVWAAINETTKCNCGGDTERMWRTRHVTSDECRILQENGFRHPTLFTSKEALRKALDAKGLEMRVRHVPIPGTDRSPYTTDWSRGTVDLVAATAAVSEPRGKVAPVVDDAHVPVSWAIQEWEPTV
jgi:hypothetical protein